MLISASYVDGFDPSAPMRYSESNFLLQIIVAAVLFATLSTLAGFKVIDASRSLRLGWSVGVGLGAVLAAVFMPLIVSTTPHYNAESEAVRWAEERYGVELAGYDVDQLFADFECDGDSGDCLNTVLLDDGTKVTAKEISGKIILIDRGFRDVEMKVAYDD